MLFKVGELRKTVPTPIEVTVVPDPIIPVSSFRVWPTAITFPTPFVVIPVTVVVFIPISPLDTVATPTKIVLGVKVPGP